MANNYVEQDKRKRYSAATGWMTIRTWEGLESEYTDFETNTLPDGYSELELATTQDGWVTVEAGYPSSTPDGSEPEGDGGLVSRTWSMIVNEEEKPLILLPKVQALCAVDPQWPLSVQIAMDQWRKATKVAIDNSEEIPNWEDFMPAAPAAATGPQQQTAVDFAEALIKGDNPVFAVPTYVLRKTEIVTTWSELVAIHTNVNRFLTYSSLTTAEPTLSTAAFLAVAGLSSCYWLKRPPQVEAVTFGQFQIEQEYWGAVDFDRFIYDAPI